MTDGLEAVTTTALSLALDAASLRQRAIAANIAHHASEGYVPVTVDFAAQIEQARQTLQAGGTLDAAALAAVRVELQPMLDAQGQPARVRLDAQMADMADNAVQYQALVRALNRHLSMLYSAASDGKR